MNNLFDMLTVVYKYKKLYERHCQAIMKKYDLRIADIDILYYVANSGPRNLSRDIVDMGMSKANVSKSVEHLRKKGLVELAEDEEDRRCVHIKPTEQADDVIKEVACIRHSLSRRLTLGIPQEDRAAVDRVLQRLSENVSEELFEMEERATGNKKKVEE